MPGVIGTGIVKLQRAVHMIEKVHRMILTGASVLTAVHRPGYHTRNPLGAKP